MTGNVDQQESDAVRNLDGRFVILTHDHPFLHWDLMLEDAGVLRTWRLLQEPARDVIIAAELLPDHRLHYLEYEGPVSGGRGCVSRWDHGRHVTRESPTGLVAAVEGGRLSKTTMLLTTSPDGASWTLRIS